MKHQICPFCHLETYSKFGSHELCRLKEKVAQVNYKELHVRAMLEISKEEAEKRYEEAVRVTINGNDQEEIEKAWVERRKMYAILEKDINK